MLVELPILPSTSILGGTVSRFSPTYERVWHRATPRTSCRAKTFRVAIRLQPTTGLLPAFSPDEQRQRDKTAYLEKTNMVPDGNRPCRKHRPAIPVAYHTMPGVVLSVATRHAHFTSTWLRFSYRLLPRRGIRACRLAGRARGMQTLYGTGGQTRERRTRRQGGDRAARLHCDQEGMGQTQTLLALEPSGRTLPSGYRGIWWRPPGERGGQNSDGQPGTDAFGWHWPTCRLCINLTRRGLRACLHHSGVSGGALPQATGFL